MPEYLAPGVYIDETSSGLHPVPGVSTSTAGFVGQTVRGPREPKLVTSWREFEGSYGGLADPDSLSYLPFAVKGFFDNGGQRAYVARVVSAATGKRTPPAHLTVGDFVGEAPRRKRRGSGLSGLEAIDEIALLCAPDEGHAGVPATIRAGIREAVVLQCERRKDRFAILQLTLNEGGGDPTKVVPPISSSYAAVYYPWIRVAGSAPRATHLVPPGGHIAGIYAKTDVERGVHKAPANAEVLGVVTANLPRGDGPLAVTVTDAQQNILNPRGINVIRDFRAQGRGVRVWGARTLAGDPRWKYVNVRRLLIFLEESIQKGIGWAVSEPNVEAMWAQVVDTISVFLTNVWRSGGLLGAKPEEAFFVRCDRTTMTQNDIDNGRVIALVGVAPLRPAEFVIFRVGQKTVGAS